MIDVICLYNLQPRILLLHGRFPIFISCHKLTVILGHTKVLFDESERTRWKERMNKDGTNTFRLAPQDAIRHAWSLDAHAFWTRWHEKKENLIAFMLVCALLSQKLLPRIETWGSNKWLARAVYKEGFPPNENISSSLQQNEQGKLSFTKQTQSKIALRYEFTSNFVFNRILVFKH